MSADFISIALPLDPARALGLVETCADAEVEYDGNIFIDASDELMALVDDDVPLAISPSFAAFVALDRFAAEPAGITLLDGHAYRWVPADELAVLASALAQLVAGGRDRVVAQVAPYLDHWGNGDHDVRIALDALDRGIASAQASGRGLLLACFPA